jgi:signal transduction histidine kinase
MAETLFEELKRYVGFDTGDEAALRALHEVAAPRFAAIAGVFYDAILAHDGARQALSGGEGQVGRLQVTLQRWLGQVLRGPWDEEYFLAHCRIGQVHVRIALPQHYMFGAMNVVRRQLNQVVDDHYLERPRELAAARRALGKILDLELAVMLHTYREDLLAQQARVERLSTFGQLVGSIGHELRNPLGVIETSLFILRGRAEGDERARKHLDRIGEQLQIANGIISDLLDLIRDRPLSRERVQLRAVVDAAAEAVRRPEGVLLRVEALDALPDLAGDPGQLRQVFVNLVENAVHAASPRGEVRVRARREGGHVDVMVEDTGPGVDPSVRRRLFEPLITTKEKGIGLGLSLVKRIVERHGGSVAYEPPAGGGARFTVRLPV